MEQLLGESNSEYNSRKEFYDFLVEEKINDADKYRNIILPHGLGIIQAI